MSDSPIHSWLDETIRQNATDLYLTVEAPPMLRIDDQLLPLAGASALTEADIEAILDKILNTTQRNEFKVKHELSLSLERGRDRFRVSVLRQRQRSALVVRRIISRIPDFAELRLPKVMEQLALEKRGLVLVCGITSSGKSTTLASMIDYRNRTLGGHIITIEDPIEFYHEHRKGLVTQRELDIDTLSPHAALKAALRQKPDVIVVGEVRDAGLMELTAAAAETGHLCLATLHASNSAQAIERIVSLFRDSRQQQIRVALGLNLRAIVTQRLVRDIEGKSLLVSEVMLNEALIRDLIMHGHTGQIHDVMAKNAATGMMTFDQSLFAAYKAGLISTETAVLEADVPADMKIALRQHQLGNKSLSDTVEIDTSKLSL